MIVDFDDLCDEHAPLDLLHALRAANPDFRCTLFAVPARCSAALLAEVPEWCELAVHGWEHGDPPTDGGECHHWTREAMIVVTNTIDRLISHGVPWTRGFKAPGWQISDGCYAALAERGWWVADQPYNDDRRPRGLCVHRLGDGDHWHGHLWDVCGNGIEETFHVLVERVRWATSFQTIGEVVAPW